MADRKPRAHLAAASAVLVGLALFLYYGWLSDSLAAQSAPPASLSARPRKRLIDPGEAGWVASLTGCARNRETCESLLSPMPCLDDRLDADSTCGYTRIASCYPGALRECLDTRLAPNRWLVIAGDSVSKYAQAQLMSQILRDAATAIPMSHPRYSTYTPGVQHDNSEHLVFGKFVVSSIFLGGAGGDLTPNNIRAALNISEATRNTFLRRVREAAQEKGLELEDEDRLFRKPDVMVINSGLWDSRSSSKSYYSNYVNSMLMWRKLLEDELQMSPNDLYWRSTTPVHPLLHQRDPQRKNMTLERIEELNALAYESLVRDGHWHYINGYRVVSSSPHNETLMNARISADGYHPNSAALCDLLDVVFASICDDFLTQLDPEGSNGDYGDVDDSQR